MQITPRYVFRAPIITNHAIPLRPAASAAAFPMSGDDGDLGNSCTPAPSPFN
jgi:hypothetical protein